mmetsp:Transcript_36236/g.41410  ORF Transcript_36236/g.41410 Transcript_36236/m.41410 type:complete len:93 (+) Transcript_36236:162-440(+)
MAAGKIFLLQYYNLTRTTTTTGQTETRAQAQAPGAVSRQPSTRRNDTSDHRFILATSSSSSAASAATLPPSISSASYATRTRTEYYNNEYFW